MDFINTIAPSILVVIASSFNWLVALFGATLVWRTKKEKDKYISVILGSAAGIMILASFSSLLLPAKDILLDAPSWHLVSIPIGFMIGILILRLLNRFLPFFDIITNPQVYTMFTSISKPSLSLTTISMHNIPEGIALGVAFAGTSNTTYLPAIALAIGISMRNFSKATTISVSMHNNGAPKLLAMLQGQLFAIVELLFAIMGCMLVIMLPSILPFALSISAGIIMYICIEELIPEANHTCGVDIGTISCIIGFLLFMTLDNMLS